MLPYATIENRGKLAEGLRLFVRVGLLLGLAALDGLPERARCDQILLRAVLGTVDQVGEAIVVLPGAAFSERNLTQFEASCLYRVLLFAD